MSKKLLAVFLVLALSFSLMLVGCGGGNENDPAGNEPSNDGKEVYRFTLHHQDPPSAAMGEFFEAYAQKLNDESDGRIVIDIHPSATLGAPPESYTLVTTGVADLSWGQIAQFPGQFPGTEALSLPMVGIQDAYMGGKILWDLYNETDLLEQEYKDVHVLFLQTNMDAPLGTNVKVTSSDDLKGLKIRCSGGPVTQFVAKLGGNPMSIPITELYTSLEKNIVNGFISDWHGVDGFKLAELAKFYLDEKIQVMPFWFVMNQDKWNSLPEDIQQIFTENSGDAALLEIEQYYNSRLQKVTNDITTSGGEINKLSPDERAKWQAAAEETWADWAKEYEGKGIDVQAVLDEVRERVNNFSR